MNLGLVTAPPEECRITAVPFAQRPLYAVLADSYPYARRKELFFGDLADDEWILNRPNRRRSSPRSPILSVTYRMGPEGSINYWTVSVVDPATEFSDAVIVTTPVAFVVANPPPF